LMTSRKGIPMMTRRPAEAGRQTQLDWLVT
jgi:hypothetical protein